MLEIILLSVLWKKFAELAVNRGRTKAWGSAAIVSWVAGEVLGFVAAGLGGIQGLAAYAVALLGAGVFVLAAYFGVKSLRPTWESRAESAG